MYDHGWRKQDPPRTAGADESPGDRLSSQEYAARGIESWAMYLGDDDRASHEVAQDIRQRALRVGRAKYGTFLYPDNGRDSLVDAYQELLDGVGYVGNEARSTEDGALGREVVDLLRDMFEVTVRCKRLLLTKEKRRDRPAAARLVGGGA